MTPLDLQNVVTNSLKGKVSPNKSILTLCTDSINSTYSRKILKALDFWSSNGFQREIEGPPHCPC